MGIILIGAVGAYFAMAAFPSLLFIGHVLIDPRNRRRPWILVVALAIVAPLTILLLFAELAGPFWAAKRIAYVEILAWGAWNWHLIAIPGVLAACLLAGQRWGAANALGLGVAIGSLAWGILILGNTLAPVFELAGFVLTH